MLYFYGKARVCALLFCRGPGFRIELLQLPGIYCCFADRRVLYRNLCVACRGAEDTALCALECFQNLKSCDIPEPLQVIQFGLFDRIILLSGQKRIQFRLPLLIGELLCGNGRVA